MNSFRALFLRNVAAVGLLPILVLTVFLLRDQEDAGRAALDRQLVQAATSVHQLLGSHPPAQLQRELQNLDRSLKLRLSVIDLRGNVIADSEAAAPGMDNHLNRPEVQQALQDGIGHADRFSATLKMEMRYLAIVDRDDPAARIYRAAIPLAVVQAQVRKTQITLLGVAGVGFLLAIFVATRLSRQLVTPVEALIQAAARFSAGDSAAHVFPDGPQALRRLGTTFNGMVDRLSSQVRRLDEAQGYLEAIIRQMPDGLLVLDRRGTILRVNPAAESLLGMPSSRLVGRTTLAVLLNYSLDAELRRVLSEATAEGGEAETATVEMRTPEGRVLQVALGPFFNPGQVEGGPAGAMMILQDVTQLRHADEMRRDFVANVSHELRTPIAAIRALVETLALRGAKRPELLAEYSPRIVGECERIDRLVQDLLLLAQTEAGHLRLQRELLHPREIAEDVARLVEPVLAGTDTRLILEEFADCDVLADRFALAQCIRNLVDNAVRYAGGGVVRVGSRRIEDQVEIYVSDTGPGIPREHLARIFERFYRIDKARSRDAGGSGLGLSIVRHLAEVQGGKVRVESEMGRGTTFFLRFPVA